MSDVKRYVTTCDCTSEAAWGDYVRHSDYEALHAENARLRARVAEVEALRGQLSESRANDRTAMGYLSDVRQIVGGGDFPTMVANVARMAEALCECLELIETITPFEGSEIRKARAAMAAKEGRSEP